MSCPCHLRVIHIAFSAGLQLDLIRADNPGDMTTTSLIALNAALAATVVAAILRLLVHGIHSDRMTVADAVQPDTLDDDLRDQLAA